MSAAPKDPAGIAALLREIAGKVEAGDDYQRVVAHDMLSHRIGAVKVRAARPDDPVPYPVSMHQKGFNV